MAVAAELDVRTRVAGGEWASVGSAHAEGGSVAEIGVQLAQALRDLADEIETQMTAEVGADG